MVADLCGCDVDSLVFFLQFGVPCGTASCEFLIVVFSSHDKFDLDKIFNTCKDSTRGG